MVVADSPELDRLGLAEPVFEFKIEPVVDFKVEQGAMAVPGSSQYLTTAECLYACCQ